MTSRWQLIDRGDRELLEHLCDIRGFAKAEIVPDFTKHLHDPNLLPDMAKARELICQAAKKRSLVVIFGDYDADGTPASALLSHVLTRLEIPHRVILPKRQEGYGLRIETIESLPSETKLLITVDTGITNVAEIARAKKRGIKVIILDHHLPGPKLPAADAIVDPFIPDSTYPFTGLCGCAIAYKLTEALAQDFPAKLNEAFRKWLLDLVAISTVADMMSLRDENRALVHYGLMVLQKTRRPGLKALLAVAGLPPEKITTGSIGYVIGPRLNASGRLGDNMPALKLLTTTDEAEATALAAEIEANNNQRQQAVSVVIEAATRLLFKQNRKDDRCFIVHGDDWPSGVVGLVAGRLSGQYNRPVVVVTGEGEMLTGSARSTNNYSIIDGLRTNESWLTRFGGHRQAAGLSLTRENLPKFIDGLKSHAAAEISVADLVPVHVAEAELIDDELSLATAAALAMLSPFGQDNPQPLFLIRDVTLGEARVLGNGGDHLKWQTNRNGNRLEIIGFGLAKRRGELPTKADLLGHLEINSWRERQTLQLRLVDFRPAGGEIERTNVPVKKSVRVQ